MIRGRAHNSVNLIKILLPVLLAGSFVPLAQGAVSFTTLHSFEPAEGFFPVGGLVQGVDGNFYGTTYAGGASWPPDFSSGNIPGGTVFKITPDGTFTSLYSFSGPDGHEPYGGALVQGTDGNFYGTTGAGGPEWDPFSMPRDFGHGTIFKITSDGILTTLYSFSGPDGAWPTLGLVEADGSFYGMTTVGGPSWNPGQSQGHGTLFKLSPDGMLTTLHAFNGPDGANPDLGGLVQGRDGNFYGTTAGGGTNGGHGTVFRVAPDGTLTTLVSFDGTNGAQPEATLAQATDGSFFGTTEGGGAYTNASPFGNGTVFKMSPSGTLTTLVSFNGTNGWAPRSMVQGTDGNFYGTTGYGGATPEGFGTIFKITPDGMLTTLVSFTGTNGPYLGAGGPCTIVQGSDGNFYGTTGSGGAYQNQFGNGYGTIFRLTVPGADKPKIVATSRSGGTAIVTWLALRSRSYQLQSATNLTQLNWTASRNPVTATNTTATASDSIASDAQRFYRVVLLP